MIKRYGDILSGAFMLLIAAAMFISSFSIKVLTVSKIGAAFVPQLIAGVLAILSILVIINGYRSLQLAKANSEEMEKDEPIRTEAVVGTIIVLLAYVVLLEKIGFIITTALYLFAQFFILADKSQRKIPLFAGLAIIISVGVYYLFVNVFQLMLPPGILG
ncbi:MAG: tripartite tricarboxylate transporter TctB family protein [Clostridia bacterium]